MLAFKEEHLPHYNYEDYKQWEGDWELIDGIPYSMAPTPNITHQELNLNIGLEGEFKKERYTFKLDDCEFDFSFEMIFDL